MIGMLWFDNDPKKSLADKMTIAAEYYRNKYHKAANCCYVHPSMIPPESEPRVNGIAVKASKQLIPNHIWMGCNER